MAQQQTLLLSPGATDLGQQLLDKNAIFVGPAAIEVSTEVAVLATNGLARKRGPDLVLADGPGLEEVLRAQLEQNSDRLNAD